MFLKWYTWLAIAAFYHVSTVIGAVLQPDDEQYSKSLTADLYDWELHPCRRKCQEGQKPMICRYIFVVEKYTSMSKACHSCPYNLADCFRPHCIPAEGTIKSLYVVNRQMPGPLIEVCQNDIISVEVRNRMVSESTTIHWHGASQMGTPYMDGVPYVTQCPILPGQNFEYIFRADSPGTYFWHSHSGVQRSDGLYGPLLVHPLKERYLKLYDLDVHYMMITDWTQIDADHAFLREYYNELINPTTILVNGLGRYRSFPLGFGEIYTPSATFVVSKNKRHRFRMINSGAEDCPLEMSIDGHTMTVISLDSNDVEPVEVDSIVSWTGERVDFILTADKNPGNYWIRLRGYGLCRNQTNPNLGVFQVAILRYEGAPEEDPRGPFGYTIPLNTGKTRILNPYQRGTETSNRNNIHIPLLSAAVENDICLKKEADETVFIGFDFYPLDNYDFHRKNLYGYREVNNTFPNRAIGTFQLNNITLRLQPFPLLSQRDEIRKGQLCNAENIPPNCYKPQCACTHVIPLKLNSVVELVLVDEGRYAQVNHPLHLHGHFFRILATKNLPGPVSIERVKKLMREGKIERRLDRAPYKDTMKAPGGGYTILRFYANNPGYWFFHCHFDQHANIGMALVFKVGKDSEMPPVPKGFPKCGNYRVKEKIA